MKKNVFITGNSLVCALGNNKNQCISKALLLNENNYTNYANSVNIGNKAYRLSKNINRSKDEIFLLLKNIILSAINEANLTNNEIQDLSVFIGSTSLPFLPVKKIKISNKIAGFPIIDVEDINKFIKNLLPIKDDVYFIQSACTSSSNAFILASNQVQNNQIKRALVIGFEFYNKITYSGFESLMLLSKSNTYLPFNENNNGLILGEGFSAIILDNSKKSKIKYISSATTFDNFSQTNSNPKGNSSFLCMKKSIENAKLDLKEISCIKTHNAGSKSSDLSEINAINLLFKHYQASTILVSLKPYLGHTLGGCGTNETSLFIEFLKQDYLPKTLGIENLKNKTRNLFLRKNQNIKNGYFLMNFIGFGGTNNSIILHKE